MLIPYSVQTSAKSAEVLVVDIFVISKRPAQRSDLFESWCPVCNTKSAVKRSV